MSTSTANVFIIIQRAHWWIWYVSIMFFISIHWMLSWATLNIACILEWFPMSVYSRASVITPYFKLQFNWGFQALSECFFLFVLTVGTEIVFITAIKILTQNIAKSHWIWFWTTTKLCLNLAWIECIRMVNKNKNTNILRLDKSFNWKTNWCACYTHNYMKMRCSPDFFSFYFFTIPIGFVLLNENRAIAFQYQFASFFLMIPCLRRKIFKL